MSDTDHEWRTRLRPVSLVVEADFSAEEVRVAQRQFGAAARHLLKQDEPYNKIIKRYPALILMILAGHASLAYDHGAYWESFWDELGMPRDADFENEIRRSLVDLLDKFSLARFPDIERQSNRRYVMMLALHAGIPIHCLPDLLTVINDHILQGRPSTGASLMEWLQEPGKEYRASALDVPVRNFLLNGAEFAADILDRIIEFIEEATIDPTVFDRDLNASTTGLPCVLLEELILQLKEAPLQFERKRLIGTSTARPMVTYLIDDDEIVLEMPTPAGGSDLPWRVSLDGEVREVHAARRWGATDQTAVARAAVPGPIREAIVSHPGVAAPSSLPLVVQADPLLTFDEKGRWIPRRDGLKDCVWAVFPDDHQLVDPHTMKPVEIRDTGCPAGWHRWRSAFIELDDVDALQLQRDDALVGTPRWVRKDARPRFELGEIATGVVTPEGRTVYNTRPWVMLPAKRTEEPPRWTVRVRRVGDSDWLVDEEWLGEDGEVCVDPFDDAEERQLGYFEVLVTGPLGSDARCAVFLAEGLHASFAPSIRVPVAGGLTGCVGVVESDGVSIASGDPITFGHRDLERLLDVHSEDMEATLLLRPPHVEIRSGETGVPLAWRMTPDVCDPEDFSQDRLVAVRAPGVSHVEFGYVSDFGDMLQIDSRPRQRQGDVFETRTQQFADTVRHHSAGRIVATLHTEDGPIEVTVLSAHPRLLATGVRMVEGALEFDDVADVEDLATYVWNATAPWRAAESLSVVGGRAVLPEAFIDRGELRCQLFVDDPWVFIDPPAVPPESAFRVDQLGWCDDGTPAQVKLARYAGTQCRAPRDVGARPEVWTALARLHTDGKTDRFAGLIELLADDPRRALECLGDSTISASDKMAMLIRSELVNHNFTAEETLNELHSHPWFGCMVELADLPSLYNRRHEVSAERAETLAYLGDRGGEPLTELLRTGKTRRFHNTCFDSTVLEMSFVPRNRVESKLHEIQQIPRAQLHHDNLRAGIYEALCRRTEWVTSGWSPNFEKQASLVLNPMRRASMLAHETITMRVDRLKGIDTAAHPWMLMSAQSLTLSFLARLEAYGRIEGRYLNSGLLRDWSRMAQLCPTLVANDLLIAEAAVLYDRRGDLIGEDK
ncbi:hypothetical protein M1247_10200 [Mycobacterium sp. 21AC1]|uniref:hypothetical protein n=1 Tax=[Mycobacterium] appelbergii TaxID=2939269 RepID=UPI002939017D|nr:hypothetical protein [Mycobacterium sp. 21AC1]MDV3125282.1 hypothetical protein [Mycobacterium sp. 21AC1]